MQKPSSNIILFNDQQSEINESSMIKRQSSNSNIAQTNVIHQEIQFLTDKLKYLQLTTSKLAQQIFAIKNQNNESIDQQNSSNGSSKYSEKVLELIDKKIQIIIKQTQSIVSKITQNFDKKLKFFPNQQTKTNFNFKDNILALQKKYLDQVQKIKIQNHKYLEQLMNRLYSLQDMYAGKIMEFQKKQKDYQDKIQQMQAKIKQQRNKKIEVTQQDKITNQKNMNAVLPPNINLNDSNSRIRKHKIFQNRNNKNRSLSPIDFFTTSISAKPQISKILNKEDNKYLANLQNAQAYKGYPAPQFNKNYKVPQIINKGYTIPQVTSAIEFYRDIPKANTGWQNFQDINDNGGSNSKSQQDVFFYPENVKNEQKFLSPLDIN